MRYLLTIIGAAVLFSGGVARAGEAPQTANLFRPAYGWTYFNRPGADLSAHNAELSDCIVRTAGVRGVALGGGLMQGMADSQNGAANIENCMVVKGWRVVRLPDALGKTMSSLDRAALADRIAGFVGAEAPVDGIVRTWGNDALYQSPTRWGDSPKYLGVTSLSVKALPSAELRPAAPSVAPRKPLRPLDPAQIRAPGEGEALILIRVDGTMPPDSGLELQRRTEQSGNSADRLKAMLPRRMGLAAFKRRGQTYAFLVKPGQWHLERIAFDGFGQELGTSLCLGGPAFDVLEGEVVFAGAFDLEGLLAPNLDLAAAREVLSGTPEASEKLRAVAWVNGATFPCSARAAYALEFPDRPFVDGYRWGGAADGAPQ